MNASLSLGVALLVGSLSSGVLPHDLTLHLSILMTLMVGLLLIFNWYVSLGHFPHGHELFLMHVLSLCTFRVIAQIGLESIESQKKELKLVQE